MRRASPWRCPFSKRAAMEFRFARAACRFGDDSTAPIAFRLLGLRGEEDLFADNDGRAVASAGDGHLPENVVRLAPFEWRRLLRIGVPLRFGPRHQGQSLGPMEIRSASLSFFCGSPARIEKVVARSNAIRRKQRNMGVVLGGGNMSCGMADGWK